MIENEYVGKINEVMKEFVQSECEIKQQDVNKYNEIKNSDIPIDHI